MLNVQINRSRSREVEFYPPRLGGKLGDRGSKLPPRNTLVDNPPGAGSPVEAHLPVGGLFLRRTSSMKADTVFIGSSTQARPYAQNIASRLRAEFPQVSFRGWWFRDVFRNGETFIESLERECRTTTAGLFVFSPDDDAVIRNEPRRVPRDNVVFEYGLFTGVHGRGRVAIVQVDSASIPTDLAGIALAQVATKDGAETLADEAVEQLRFWVDGLSSVNAQLLPRVTEVLALLRPSLSALIPDKTERFDRIAAMLLQRTFVSVLTDNLGVNESFALLAEKQLKNCISISAYDATGPSGWVGPATYRYLAGQVRDYLFANGSAEHWDPYVHDWLSAALIRCLERAKELLPDSESKTRFDNERLPSVGIPKLQYSRILLWTEQELRDPLAEPIINLHAAFRIPLFYIPVSDQSPEKDVAFVVFEKRDGTSTALYGRKEHDYDTSKDTSSLQKGRIPGIGYALERYKRTLEQPSLLLAMDARELLLASGAHS
jgi:predicted nucleotide-binding protein